MEIGYTENFAVGASYEGVQPEGDCSANLLGITAIGLWTAKEL
jgi:hypothetical protein